MIHIFICCIIFCTYLPSIYIYIYIHCMCVYGYLPILFHMIAGTVNPTWLFHIGPRVNLTLAASSMNSFLAKWSQNFTKPSEQHPSVCLTVSCLPRLNCTTATAPWKFACFQTTDSWRPWYGWVHPQWPTELSSHTYTKWDIHRNGNLNPENDRPRDFAVSNLRKPNTYIYIYTYEPPSKSTVDVWYKNIKVIAL